MAATAPSTTGAGSRSWNGPRDAPARRAADFTSRLRSPAVAARVGLWLGICFGVAFVTGLVSHFAQSPDPPVPFPTQPVVGLPRHPGPARHQPVRRPCRCCWSSSGRSSPSSSRARRATSPSSCCTAPSGSRSRSSSRPRSSSSPPAWPNAAQWYPWALLLPGHPLRPRAGSPSARCSCTSRSSCRSSAAALVSDVEADTLDRPGTRDDDRRPVRAAACCARTWLAAGVAVLATAGSTVPWLRKVSVFGVRSGDGPAGHPDQQVRARPPGSPPRRPAPGVPLTVAYGGREVVADPRRPGGDAAADARRCRSPASRAGARSGDLDRRPAARPARPGRRAARAATCASSRSRSAAPSGSRTLPGNFADDPLTLLALGLERRAAVARPRLPVPADRARTGPGCCRPSGSAGWR